MRNETSPAGGGTALFDPQIGELRSKAIAVLSARAAAAAGVRSGDTIDLLAGGQAVLRELSVRVSENAPDGTVGIVDGLVEEPANRVAAGTGVSVGNIRRGRVPAGGMR